MSLCGLLFFSFFNNKHLNLLKFFNYYNKIARWGKKYIILDFLELPRKDSVGPEAPPGSVPPFTKYYAL